MPERPFEKYKALLQERSLASTNFAASLCTNFAAAFLLVMSEFLKMRIQGSLWAEQNNLKTIFHLIAWLCYLPARVFFWCSFFFCIGRFFLCSYSSCSACPITTFANLQFNNLKQSTGNTTHTSVMVLQSSKTYKAQGKPLGSGILVRI